MKKRKTQTQSDAQEQVKRPLSFGPVVFGDHTPLFEKNNINGMDKLGTPYGLRWREAWSG